MASDSDKSAKPAGPAVAVYLVTYRRHALLQRSIASVLSQTHRNLRLYVVNDDPADGEVAQILAAFGDLRAALFKPVSKRGATGSFALVFAEAEADYAALLEDDNWWEPGFLQSQIAVLESRRDAVVCVGNERIWREERGGSWTDTGRTIWPFSDVRDHHFRLGSICGGTVYCNSSALVRVARDCSLAVPASIPVDVTEHFRERLLPATIPLNGEVLVNYAETLTTARDSSGVRWGQYQTLLIGSVFSTLATAKDRKVLAAQLWEEVAAPTSPRAVTLVMTGLAIREARALLHLAPMMALARTALTILRRPGMMRAVSRARRSKADEWDFLVKAPLTRAVTRAGA